MSSSVCEMFKGIPITVVLRESSHNYQASVCPPDRCSDHAECLQLEVDQRMRNSRTRKIYRVGKYAFQ